MLIGSLIISTVYSGGLFTAFTVPKFTNPIRYINDMKERKIIVDKINRPIDFFLDKTFDEMTKLADKVYSKSSVDLEKAQYVLSMSNGFVEGMEKLTEKEMSNYHLIKDSLTMVPVILPLQINCTLKIYFDMKLKQMLESGLVLKWQNDFFRNSSSVFARRFHKETSSQTFVNSLNLKKIQAPFLLLISGYLISMTIFLKEIHSTSRFKKK